MSNLLWENFWSNVNNVNAKMHWFEYLHKFFYEEFLEAWLKGLDLNN